VTEQKKVIDHIWWESWYSILPWWTETLLSLRVTMHHAERDTDRVFMSIWPSSCPSHYIYWLSKPCVYHQSFSPSDRAIILIFWAQTALKNSHSP